MTTPSRILVVDDESDIRLVVGLNLQLAGLEFGQASNGREAIEMLTVGGWDGCILDLAMPGVDGYAVLNAMTAAGAIDDMGVVVLSAHAAPAEALRALSAGAHVHVTKPFSPHVVTESMSELLGFAPQERAAHRRTMIARAEELQRLGVPVF